MVAVGLRASGEIIGPRNRVMVPVLAEAAGGSLDQSGDGSEVGLTALPVFVDIFVHTRYRPAGLVLVV